MGSDEITVKVTPDELAILLLAIQEYHGRISPLSATKGDECDVLMDKLRTAQP